MRDVGWQLGGGAQLVVTYSDSVGRGFFDPDLGALRRAAFEEAVAVWSATLRSNVPIHVDASFSELPCEAGDISLGRGYPTYAARVSSGPLSELWFPIPLAESIEGQNLPVSGGPAAPDVKVEFNIGIDEDCTGSGFSFYYGSGTAPPDQGTSYGLSMHELGHSLGFHSFWDHETNSRLNGRNDPFLIQVWDNVLDRSWATLSDAEIVQSAMRDGFIAWTGQYANRRAQEILGPSPGVAVTSAAEPIVFLAERGHLGPVIHEDSATGRFVVVDDGSAAPDLGCRPLTNGRDVEGNIAVIRRGDCTAVEKVRNAQSAGAAGAVIINDRNGRNFLAGRLNTDIVIPSVSLSDTDGALLLDLIANAPTETPDPDLDPDPEIELPTVCEPSLSRLCLNQSRFKIEAMWRTAGAATATPAFAVPITSDTGYFWFFDSTNIEVVVKALDGCSTNGHFWIFAAGLTDVEVEIRAVDTQTGKARRFASQLGQAFQPVFATDAFASCSKEQNETRHQATRPVRVPETQSGRWIVARVPPNLASEVKVRLIESDRAGVVLLHTKCGQAGAQCTHSQD